MSIVVEVRQFEVERATCYELGCHWQGPIRLRRGRAQADADAHYKYHEDAWERLQQEWDNAT